MNNLDLFYAFLKRLMILIVISSVAVIAVSELFYQLMKDPTSRAPRTVELVIPPGTAARVAAGESPPGIPKNLVFIVGDTLMVKNEDTVPHQFDLLFIPPGASASMKLGQANDFSFTCSFQVSHYYNLTVKEGTTWMSRLQALWFGVPVTTMFLLTYSFIFWPLRPAVKP